MIRLAVREAEHAAGGGGDEERHLALQQAAIAQRQVRRIDAVVAYLLQDESGGGEALFAPVFAEVGEALLSAAGQAGLAFLDGSFWSDRELDGVGVTKSARALGHAPVGGPGGSLAAFAERLPRASNCNVYFAHLNNTNPLLDETSDAAAQLGRAGFALAEDGLEFRL